MIGYSKHVGQWMLCAVLGMAFLVLAFPQKSKAQNLDDIAQAVAKGHYAHAKAKLEQAIHKYPSNPAVFYQASRFYALDGNPYYQIDTAAFYATAAQSIYHQLSSKSADKMNALGITGAVLDKQKKAIDATGFAMAQQTNTEAGYHHFLRSHSNAIEKHLATRLRDSLGFVRTEQRGEYKDYMAFWEMYPRSHLAEIAKQHYHRLLYEHRTKGNSMADYLQFLKDHPESPHKLDAEIGIFRLYTADHEAHSYEQFLKEYPKSLCAPRAWHWLFSLSAHKEGFLERYPATPIAPWIKQIDDPNSVRVPYAEGGFIGFSAPSGKVSVLPRFDSLSSAARCHSPSFPSWAVFSKGKAGLVGINGDTLLPFEYEQIAIFQEGLLLVKQGGKWGLAHPAGFVLLDCDYDEIVSFSPSMLKVRVGQYWGLCSFNGLQVLPHTFEDVLFEPPHLIAMFDKGKYRFLDDEQLLSSTQPWPMQGARQYKMLSDRSVRLEIDGAQSLWEISGKNIIASPSQDIVLIQDTWAAKHHGGWQVYRADGTLAFEDKFEAVTGLPQCCAVKKSGLWGVIDPKGFWLIPPSYENATPLGEQSVLLQRGAKQLIANPSIEAYEATAQPTQVFKLKRTTPEEMPTACYVATRAGKKGLLGKDGSIWIPFEYEEIQQVGDSLVLLQQRGRWYLSNPSGERRSPYSFDGIAPLGKSHFSVQQGQKFGIIAAGKGMIASSFDRVPQQYGKLPVFFVYKEEKGAFINEDGQPISEFVFEEMAYWTSEKALVKHLGLWKIYSIDTKQFEGESMDHFDMLFRYKDEAVIRTYRQGEQGLISSKWGQLAPEDYSYIRNIGTPQAPLYAAERYLGQVNLYVLLYLDAQGHLIKQQTISKQDYERMACRE